MGTTPSTYVKSSIAYIGILKLNASNVGLTIGILKLTVPTIGEHRANTIGQLYYSIINHGSQPNGRTDIGLGITVANIDAKGEADAYMV